MLDKNQRILVEHIKKAKMLKITVGSDEFDTTGDLELTFRSADIKKLSHDIALCVQDHMNRRNINNQKRT